MIDLFRSSHTLPMILQNESTECGLSCLAMLSSYYGKYSDIRSLRNDFHISAGGASVKQILNAGRSLDLQGRALKLELSEIGQLTLPAILHWDTDHFVVLSKVKRRFVVIHDPAMGVRNYQIAELDHHFTGIAIELSPTLSFTQQKAEKRYLLSQLFKATPSFRRAIRQVFLLSLMVQLLSLMFPLYLQLVIDQGISKGDRDIIFLVALLFSLVILAKTSVSHFRGLILLQFSSQLGFQLLSSTVSHLLHLPLAFFERREMGDIVSRISSLENIKQLVTQEMITVIVDGLFSIITLVLLFIYSPILALLALFFVLLLAVVRLLTLSTEKSQRQEVLQTSAKQQTRFMENIRCITVTKNYGLEDARLADWQNHYAHSINSSYRLGHFQLSLASLQSFLFGIDHVSTIYLGAAAIFSGQLTIGQLMSFVFLKQNFSSSITAMLPKLSELRLMRLELDRVSDITLEEIEVDHTDSGLFNRVLSGRIEVRELEFSYRAQGMPLFRNLNFKLAAGEFIVIAGRSGCGKTTLLKLLLGLNNATQGAVLVDGQPLQKFGLKRYKSQIAAVLHSDSLLVGSLAYNIHLERDQDNPERLQTACTQACIYDEICSLPLEFNTQVGEMGVALSAGQIQRVLLARALYRRPKILILDESLSHLSTDVAAQVIANIRRVGTTLILVSHNPGFSTLADHIIDLGLETSVQNDRLGKNSTAVDEETSLDNGK